MTAAASLGWPGVRVFAWNCDRVSRRPRPLDSDETVKRPSPHDDSLQQSIELLRRAHQGDARALDVEVERGVFAFDNSTAGDAIAQADVGNNAYIVDDQTVAKTDGGGTRSIAGVIEGFDGTSVLVRVGA